MGGYPETQSSVFVLIMEKKRSRSETKESDSIWDCGSPLYDSYELASFGHVLERHTMALPYPCRPSMQLRIISNKPKAEARVAGEMGNLDGVGLFRKVVKWTLWKTRIRRDRK
ncbi:hypothetical protein QQP08_010002 [Theobroma cacao]|nr:hypothetical protein QQP08_010002 [Theobroma cacao]